MHSVAEAQNAVQAALIAHNTAPEIAAVVARALVAAEIDGQAGHGFSRVASYAAQARSGKVDGHAVPVAKQVSPGLVRVDAAHGFAYPAIDLAIAQLCEVAPEQGIAAAGIFRSHHAGVLGAHVERLAEAGLIAIMVANTPKAIAPWGGDRPVFGTNPIAFAAPVPDAPPLVIDLSLSKVARGKILSAQKSGADIPAEWAFDADGAPTTDPAAALAGTMAPAADAKGAALALMVEILAATLTGAVASRAATSFFEPDGAPPSVGQLIIAVDTAGFAGAAYFEQMAALLAAIEVQEGARLPGATRLLRRAAAQDGFDIPAHLWDEVLSLGSD